MRIALLVSHDAWFEQIDKTLTADIAAEDTDSGLCYPINATEAGPTSNCNCFTPAYLSDSDGMRFGQVSFDQANTNRIG
jgi:hypothetical protein